MHSLERFARRHPAGTAAMAGLALLLLPATLLPRGRGRVTDPPAAAQPATAAQDSGQAGALLAAVRGASPLLCDLVTQSMGNGWGWYSGDGEDAPALGRGGDESRRVLSWLAERHGSGADLGVLRAGLADGDACVRRTAARLLARDQLSGGVDALLEALAAGDPARREAAILGLGYAGTPRAVGPLTALLNDPDPEIRGGAVWALGHSETRSATPSVLRLADDREPRVRRAAARALGRLEDPAAVPTLAQLLGRDPDASVRRAAAWALGKIE